MPEPKTRKARQQASTLLVTKSEDDKTFTVQAVTGIDQKEVRQAILDINAKGIKGLFRLTVTSDRPVSVNSRVVNTVQI